MNTQLNEENVNPQDFLEMLKEMLEYHNSLLTSKNTSESLEEKIKEELLTDNHVVLKIIHNLLYGYEDRVIN